MAQLRNYSLRVLQHMSKNIPSLQRCNHITAACVSNTKLLSHGNSLNHPVRYYGQPNIKPMVDEALEENHEAESTSRESTSLPSRLNIINRKLRNIDVVHKEEILSILELMEKSEEHMSSGDALSLLQICATHMVAESKETKLDTLHKVWNSLLNDGPHLDIRHYNFLLSSYNELEHMFEVSEFLSKVESAGLTPNQVTYQGLIHRYCKEGNVKAAKTILEFMKSKDLSINVAIFNSLILGYVRSGNFSDAVGVLEAMSGINLSADGESYCILVCHQIQQGDLSEARRLLQEATEKNISISTRDYMDIIYSLAQHQPDTELIQQMLQEASGSIAYNKFAIQVCWKLVNLGAEDIALLVVRSMNRRKYKNDEFQPSGSFFINQLVQLNRPYEVIVQYCSELYKSGENKLSFTQALFAAYTSENYDLAYRLAFDALYDHDIPVRGHYFWPLLNLATNKSEQEGWALLQKMSLHGASFNWQMIYNTVVARSTLEPEELCAALIDNSQIYKRTAVHNLLDYYLNKHDLAKAARLLNKMSALSPTADYTGTAASLLSAYSHNTDTFSLLNLLTVLHGYSDRFLLPQCIAQLHRNQGGHMIVTKLLKDLYSEGVGVSPGCCSNIKQTLRDSLSEENTTLLNKLIYSQPRGGREIMPGVVFMPRAEHTGGDAEEEKSRLESQYLRMKSSGLAPGTDMLATMLREFCRALELEKARDVLQELESRKYALSNGQLALLLMLYSYKEELGDALRIYTTLEARKCTKSIDVNKSLTFALCLLKHDKYTRALDIIREVSKASDDTKEKNARTTKHLCDKIMSQLSSSGDVDKVQEMFSLLESRGLINPVDFHSVHNVLVDVHIARNDIVSALSVCEDIYSKTGYLPMLQSLVDATLTGGNKEHFTRLVTMMRERFGEVTALHHLALGFIRIGNMQDARHLFETPGLKIQNKLLSESCHGWLRDGRRELITQLLDATDRVFDVNRDMLMFIQLQASCGEDNVAEAEEIFSQLRTEEVNVSPRVLHYYANFLHKHKLPVPFVVPDEEDVRRYNEERNIKPDKSRRDLTFENRKDVPMHESDMNSLLYSLLGRERIEEAAVHVAEMYEAGRGGSLYRKHEIRLYQALAHRGMVGELDKFIQIVPQEHQWEVYLPSSYIAALVNCNRPGEAVDGMEKFLQERVDGKHSGVMFPYTGVSQILEAYPRHKQACNSMAEKYAEFGSLGPAFTMFAHHVVKKDYIAADTMWTKYLQDADEKVVKFGGPIDSLFESKDLEAADKLVPFILNSNISSNDKAHNISRCIHLYVSCRSTHTAVALLDSCIHNNKFTLSQVAPSALVRLQRTAKMLKLPFTHNIDFIENVDIGRDRSRENSSELPY